MKKNLTLLITSLTAVLLLAGQSQAQSDISGSVLYHLKNNKPISSVDVKLYTLEGEIEIAAAITDLNGSYSFTDIEYGSYRIEASTTIMPGGINMADAVKVRLHLWGVQTLDEFQQLAADVDNDGEITWDDYDDIVEWFMQGTPFNTGPWVFQTLDFVHSGAKTNVPTMGGSSSGDVNGTFVPSTRDLVAIESAYTEKQAGNDFSVEIYAQDIQEASAMGLVIDYPVSMVNINEISSPLGETMKVVENGKIRVSWINQLNNAASLNPNTPVLVIKANTTSTYNGSDIRFVIDPESHFSDYKGEQIATRYSLPLITMQGSNLSGNYPNPFNGSTNITYTIPADSKVNLSLYNQQGQLVKVITDEDALAGTYNINFDSNGLEAGVYYYTLKTTGNVTINETKRMIITR